MRKKKLKQALTDSRENVRLNAEKVAELWLENSMMRTALDDLTELNKLLVKANGALNHQLQQKPVIGPNRPNRKKLTDREAKDIRNAWIGGMKQKDLADNYGVNPATISRLVRGIYH